ncbi:TIGR03617 family F420-dependent LLM class oxidoreductase [Nocardioides sp. LHG3406-4]|uniref:TIGR03617 family F420-dependent LLM class oxidoreductase n=1 Tax=Nocardioides sp. LHG3406-4 TaxID=2804575 RepID=UPI003CE83977
MEVDLYPGTGLRLADAAGYARLTESAGLGGLWALEAAYEPFSPLAIAAQASTRVELRTAIAVAFARSPMLTAQLAHELVRASAGRFTLGLGSQVRAHIVRRFSQEWSEPVERMAEYVEALRAIWACWNDDEPLDFQGRFYQHTLMTPMFDPGPSGHPMPPIHLAAVGPAMIAMAAERADGVVLHPLSSVRTITDRVLPLVAERRAAADFEVTCPVLVVTGGTDEELDRARAAVRKQLAFYASTPAYRWVFELYDEGDRADRLRELSRAGQWNEMTDLITDELLSEFAVEARCADLVGDLRARHSGHLDRAGLYAPYELAPERWLEIGAGR